MIKPPEATPLLGVGFHHLTLTELRAICVDQERFAISSRRALIMAGVEKIARRMVQSSIVGELWVNGSFLSKKIDPDDADVLVRCGGGIYDECYPDQKEALNWVISNLHEECLCDSYHLFEYWPSHPLFSEGEFNRAWYMSRWGFKDGGDEGDFKGIAVVDLPGGVK